MKMLVKPEYAKELNDDDLQKVNGGNGYVEGEPKYSVGYHFTHPAHSSAPTDFLIIASIVRYVDSYYGYEYSVDLYYNNVLQVSDYRTICDKEMDEETKSYY